MVRIIKDESHEVGRGCNAYQRIIEIPPTDGYPEGVKYRLVLLDADGRKLVCLDNHGGHGHHLHIRERMERYVFRGIRQLREDFWRIAQEELR